MTDFPAFYTVLLALPWDLISKVSLTLASAVVVAYFAGKFLLHTLVRTLTAILWFIVFVVCFISLVHVLTFVTKNSDSPAIVVESTKQIPTDFILNLTNLVELCKKKLF